MIARFALGAAVLMLASCADEPRSVEFFQYHPEVALEVLTLCATGAKGGDECVNARTGLSAARREERMDAYRQRF